MLGSDLADMRTMSKDTRPPGSGIPAPIVKPKGIKIARPK